MIEAKVRPREDTSIDTHAHTLTCKRHAVKHNSNFGRDKPIAMWDAAAEELTKGERCDVNVWVLEYVKREYCTNPGQTGKIGLGQLRPHPHSAPWARAEEVAQTFNVCFRDVHNKNIVWVDSALSLHLPL